MAALLGPTYVSAAAGQETFDARADLEARIIERDEGQKRLLPGGSVMRIKVGPDNSGAGYLFMGYDEMPPGSAIPRHRHEIDEETLIVHRDTVRFALGGETAVAEAGDAVFLPPGIWISAENVGSDTARVFFVFPGGTVEDCFQRIGRGEDEPAAPETAEHLAEERRWCRMSY